MNDLPLFSTYPSTPGFKVSGTSSAAAEAMKPRAATLREKALEMLRRRPMTADEVAAAMRESVLAIRPRITELKEMGRIVKTGERRKNASGQSAWVWRAA